MSGFGISNEEWDKYSDLLRDFYNDTANQKVIWHKVVSTLHRYGEDSPTPPEVVELRALVSYNAFRVWPINIPTDQGIMDKQYCHIYLNNRYLQELGLWEPGSYFKFNPTSDRFTVNGIKYRPMGDTSVSQSSADPLYTIITLERDTVPSHNPQR